MVDWGHAGLYFCKKDETPSLRSFCEVGFRIFTNYLSHRQQQDLALSCYGGQSDVNAFISVELLTDTGTTKPPVALNVMER